MSRSKFNSDKFNADARIAENQNLGYDWVLNHIDGLKSALLYSYEQVMHMVKNRDVDHFNPYIEDETEQRSLFQTKYRLHRELVTELLYTIRYEMNAKGVRFDYVSDLVDGIQNSIKVPPEKTFDKSKFKQHWEEIHVLATTDKILWIYGLRN